MESDFQKLKQFVRDEREKRQEYKDLTSMYLPSSFCPGLKEQVPDLKLEGTPHELDFPNFPELKVSLESPFKRGSELGSPLLASNDTEQEIRLRLQEFTTNLEDKESLIQNLTRKVSYTEDQLKASKAEVALQIKQKQDT